MVDLGIPVMVPVPLLMVPLLIPMVPVALPETNSILSVNRVNLHAVLINKESKEAVAM